MPDAVSTEPNFWGVIPAGGAGTRLWPLSRSNRPKYLLAFGGDDSLLQATWNRVVPHAGAARMMVVAGSAHANEIASQFPDLTSSNLLIEPAPRGTAPALGLAATRIAAQDQGAIMGSFAADHVVRDQAAFDSALVTAIAAAGTGALVTIGISPTRPETGYGYIETTSVEVVRTKDGVAYEAARFVEKPDRPTATAYIESGNFLWNASMFVWQVSSFLAELERQQPDLYSSLRQVAHLWDQPGTDEAIASIWKGLPVQQVDNAVMENAQLVAVVPAELGWSDIGDWHGLAALLPADENNVAAIGNVTTIDSHDSLVWSTTDRVIALIGVDNLAIIDTGDALLVVDRDRAQDVRQIVDALRETQPERT